MESLGLRRRLWSVLAWLALVLGTGGAAAFEEPAAAARAPLLLSDSGGGMTCEFYASNAYMRWQRKGGDWSDSSGKPYGDKPFASMSLVRSTVPVPLALDFSAMAAPRQRAAELPGGIVVRPIAGNGIAELASREHTAVLQRPALVLTWDDGRRDLLDPVADTYTACPTAGSLGEQPVMRVGGPNVALLVFVLPQRGGRHLVGLSLHLTATRVWGPVTLGAFALRTPALQPTPVVKGLAAQLRGDAGIEQQPDVLFAERFERNGWEAAWRRGGSVQNFQVAGAEPGVEPLQRNALKVVMEAGQHTGIDLQLPLKPLAGGTEPEELYMRYYLRLGGDWDPSDVGKLPGLAGTYGKGGWGGRTTDGFNGWSARGGFFTTPPRDETLSRYRGSGLYLYHVDASSGGYGDLVGWNLGPTGMLEKKRWYCIEHHVRLNQPGRHDGVVRAWVDGQLAYERSDLMFRSVPELRIQSAWLAVYHGGKAPAPQRMTLHIDNLVIARRYIGPMGP